MEVLSSGVNRRPAGRGLKALPNDWRFLNGNELRKPSVTPRAKNLESTYKRWDWNLSFGTSGRPWTRNDPKSYRAWSIVAALKPKLFKMQPKLYIWSIWAAFGPQLTKILPKLVMWNVWVALSPKWFKMTPKLTIWTCRRRPARSRAKKQWTCRRPLARRAEGTLHGLRLKN